MAADTLRRLLLKPLFWALIYGALIAYGVYACFNIPFEVLPRFNFPEISVTVHEAGATAAELQAQIAWPLEGQIITLPNLVDVRSSIGNGSVETDARFRQGTDPQQDLLSVNGALDRARSQLPPAVQPFAEIMGSGINEVADYSLAIPPSVPPAEVERAVMTGVVPALRVVPGVFRVEVYGSGREALWVQPNLGAMVRYGVPLASLLGALQQQVALSPGGYIRQGHQDLLIELRSLPTVRALEDVPVTGSNGPIPLSALAHIVRAPIPTRNLALLDGHASVALIVFKQSSASTIPVTQGVQRALNATSHQLPPGVKWVNIYDQGHLVHLVGTDLLRDLALGGALAIAVLLWVLGTGRGIWILALSIPLSVLAGIAWLYAAGQSLNLLTLGALTLAVGLLSDDAIIVLESIFHRWEQGDGHWQGVLQGLRDIAAPDVTGTLTTVSVFVPLLFVGGIAGLFFSPFAQAMIYSLLASLLISVSLIPLSLGFLKSGARTTATVAGRGLNWLRGCNEQLFHFVARHSPASAMVCVALFLGSIAGLVLVPINFLPLPNEGVLLESFTLPPGTSLADTEQAVQTITHTLRQNPAVAHVFARIGSAATAAYTEPAYAGEIQITLKPSVAMNSLSSLSNRLLKETRTTGVQLAIDTPTIERVGESLSGLPQPFAINLFGSNASELRRISQEMIERLRSVSSLSGIFSNDSYQVTELQITPRRAALIARHLTPAQLYAQVAPLMNGKVVAEIPDGTVPLELYVRLAGAPDQSLAELARLPIRTDGWTPLGQLANIRMIPTPNQIQHIDGALALQILATPTGPIGSTISAARKALADVKLPAGYRYAFGGIYRQLESAILGVVAAAIAAFILVLAIMILQFDGLLVPGLLLLLIPLAFTGGAFALVVSGVGLNAIGLVGFLTLIGIGLNHGIVLLYRARKNEASGMPLEDAVAEAVHVRFRPIALTTITAVLGMLPMALGWGQGAEPEQGLAAVILGGMLWSAVLSTNLLPALYLHLRLRRLTRARI